MIGLILAFGIFIGFLLGYWPLRSSRKDMQEQLNRIEQSLTAQHSNRHWLQQRPMHMHRLTREGEIGGTESVGRPQSRLWICRSQTRELGTRIKPRVPQTHSLDHGRKLRQ